MHRPTRAKVHQGTPASIARLSAALKRGELVAVPTETVYGLAGNALDVRACRTIFRAKGRPSNDPLIVHVHSVRQIAALAQFGPEARKVAAAFWPGPLTLVLPKTDAVPDIVTSGRQSVAIRVPAHPVFRRLLRACQLPLAAPSANRFGYISPTTAEHVMDGLGSRIPHILDGGACRIGVESTILDLRDPRRPVVLRPGAIEAQKIEDVLGVRVRTLRKVSPAKASAVAPGMLSRHYSPRTPLVSHPRITAAFLRKLPSNEAALPLCRPHNHEPARNVHPLSATGDLGEVAHTLFAALRAADRGGWKRLHVERARGRSALALAINDRLSRAAAKR